MNYLVGEQGLTTTMRRPLQGFFNGDIVREGGVSPISGRSLWNEPLKRAILPWNE